VVGEHVDLERAPDSVADDPHPEDAGEAAELILYFAEINLSEIRLPEIREVVFRL
jgi:hypothetical protein